MYLIYQADFHLLDSLYSMHVANVKQKAWSFIGKIGRIYLDTLLEPR